MTALWSWLWGLLIVIGLLVVYDFLRAVIHHAQWRHRWKSDSVGEYNAYRNALDRARSSKPAVRHHRPARQRR